MIERSLRRNKPYSKTREGRRGKRRTLDASSAFPRSPQPRSRAGGGGVYIYWPAANYTRQPINHGSLTQCSFIFTDDGACVVRAVEHGLFLPQRIPPARPFLSRSVSPVSLPSSRPRWRKEKQRKPPSRGRRGEPPRCGRAMVPSERGRRRASCTCAPARRG